MLSVSVLISTLIVEFLSLSDLCALYQFYQKTQLKHKEFKSRFSHLKSENHNF